MRIKVLNKRWEVLVQSKGVDPGTHAHCEGPHVKGKKIILRPELQGEELLDKAIHEFLHAADWHKDEEWVTEVASDLARFLTRLGFTKDH